MNTIQKQRTLEISIGICFILATIFYATGNGIILKSLETANSNTSFLGLGVMLEILNSIVVITIGLLLYSRLRDGNESIMIGYAFSRLAEGILLIIGSISILLVTQLSEFNSVGLISSIHENLFSVAMLLLGIYSTFFCIYLLKSSLGPKWLLILGIIGYASTTINSGFNIIFNPTEASMLLFIPGGLFELLFPIWLIVKGFPNK